MAQACNSYFLHYASFGNSLDAYRLRAVNFICTCPTLFTSPNLVLSFSLFTAIIRTEQLTPPRLGWPETYEYLADVLG